MVNISDGVPNTVGAFTAFIGARAVSRARNVAVVVALVTAMAGPAACADNTKSPEAVQRILRMAAQIAAVDDDTRFPDPFSEVCARLAVPDAEINAFRVLAFSALVRQSKVHPGAEAPEPCGQTLISAQWNYASKEAVNANHASYMAVLQSRTAALQQSKDEYFDWQLKKAKFRLALAQLYGEDPKRIAVHTVGEGLASAEAFVFKALLSDDLARSLIEYEIAALDSADWRSCLGKYELSLYGNLTADDGKAIAAIARDTETAGGKSLAESRARAAAVVGQTLKKSPELESRLISALAKEHDSESPELRAARRRVRDAIR